MRQVVDLHQRPVVGAIAHVPRDAVFGHFCELGERPATSPIHHRRSDHD